MEGGPPSFPPDSTCPVVLRCPSRASAAFAYGALTRSGRPFQTPSASSRFVTRCGTAATSGWSYNPASATPAGLTRTRFRLLPVRSPLLREYFLLPRGTEMFQFPRLPSASPMDSATVTGITRWGCPIRRSPDHACSRLPEAYRSFATSFIGRRAEASTVRLLLQFASSCLWRSLVSNPQLVRLRTSHVDRICRLGLSCLPGESRFEPRLRTCKAALSRLAQHVGKVAGASWTRHAHPDSVH